MDRRGRHPFWGLVIVHVLERWAGDEERPVRITGRKGGKAAATRRAVYEARDRGEHVHVASGKGSFCAAREQPEDCHSPRWEGLAP
jgi:hypothetical protein